MAKTFNLVRAFCIMAALLGAGVPAVFPQPGMISARIGMLIDSGEKSIHARGQEKIKRGDRFRIYVQCEDACHIYIVHTDHKTVTLLESFETATQTSGWCCPAPRNFMKWTGRARSRLSLSFAAPSNSMIFRLCPTLR